MGEMSSFLPVGAAGTGSASVTDAVVNATPDSRTALVTVGACGRALTVTDTDAGPVPTQLRGVADTVYWV
jgi:hypothetical protein